ncbi:WecB/TagA/CpsF family glycosyltransferase [Novosphingobium chloroacetimidivorans]|uniref:WecB/TagA/CpsF family glycosyltransferase n=1 Tax=Novosphingobium chloroacetimidivorans TaxID=1428314 RepID=UPI0028AA9C53|nr:WecB/TagA/CpsF family glycosyltransferase [Novosphingobium chloroacetimidivorans]
MRQDLARTNLAAPAAGAKGPAPRSPETITIGGLPIARLTRAEMAQLMLDDVASARAGALPHPRVLTSANGSVVAAYHQDPVLRAAIDAVDLVDADGMPLVFASRVFCKRPLTERAATTDFLLDASRVAADEGVRFYFLGARPGVAARAAEHLRYRFPGLQIAGTRNGYFKDEDLPEVARLVREARADVLWLGVGTPRQERMAVALRALLPGVAWVRTCGGLFDHYGGGVSRAPDWMQAFGLEWLYRGAREPLRLGWRYLVTNPVAVYYLLTRTHD